MQQRTDVHVGAGILVGPVIQGCIIIRVLEQCLQRGKLHGFDLHIHQTGCVKALLDSLCLQQLYIAADAHGKAELIALAVTGVLQQCDGLIHVGVVVLYLLRQTVAGREEAVSGNAVALSGHFDDLFPVNGIGQSLPHANIVEGSARGVEGQIVHGITANLHQLQIGIAANGIQINAGGEQAHVDLTGLQGNQTGRSLGNDAEGNDLALGLLAEVIRKTIHGGMIVENPLPEHIGTGADLKSVLRVFDDGLLVENAQGLVRQEKQDVLYGSRELQLHGVVIGRIDLADPLHLLGGVRGFHGASIGELDIAGLQLLAVVELHTLTQMEHPCYVVGLFVALGQVILKLTVIVVDKGVVRQPIQRQIGAAVGRLRIQRGHVLLGTNHQFLLYAGLTVFSVLAAAAASQKTQCHHENQTQRRQLFDGFFHAVSSFYFGLSYFTFH